MPWATSSRTIAASASTFAPEHRIVLGFHVHQQLADERGEGVGGQRVGEFVGVLIEGAHPEVGTVHASEGVEQVQ